MHEEKIALVRRQIEALAAAVASRNIRHVWVVACGGSLATLDPFRYILTAETDKVSAAAVNAAEFAAELPQGDWERIVWWFSTLKAAPRQRPSARRNWLRSAAL